MSHSITIFEDPLTLVVGSRRMEGRDVAVIELRAVDGGTLPAWTAGAHIGLRLGAEDLVREYSLCGSPSDRRSWRIAVRLAEGGRGGSAYVHAHLTEGARVEVVQIGNLFRFDPGARAYFVAAGIGITPVLPMIEAAEENGLPWQLLYLGRYLDGMPFLEQLSGFGDRVTVVESSTMGRVDLGAVVAGNTDAHFYACGPTSLLDALEDAARRHPGVRLSVERFTPRGPAEEQANAEFTIMLESSDQVIPVRADQSTLSALLEAGVRVRNSCGEGTCGSCEVVVLDGVPDHRDSILTDEERLEGDCMYVCVSRSRSATLTLDL
ncbi:PDR/VanB family oxidoreductase [Microbacterium sp. SORGH_AS_0888]|uniref:PDR/VanB family oxidoreductase n=1 Tax=Microbacterium sp. SORGH_AS_0888 TaxID=3041791 RepID=UPI00277D3265|nr:PDR/VanB family oxidoreductase [Microbacterium sp. SORGH_AS_0888]MDQ1128614.1 ferredoxin-NADP reductase [Microbacterium sp. SORGH_AS_0888]